MNACGDVFSILLLIKFQQKKLFYDSLVPTPSCFDYYKLNISALFYIFHNFFKNYIVHQLKFFIAVIYEVLIKFGSVLNQNKVYGNFCDISTDTNLRYDDFLF